MTVAGEDERQPLLPPAAIAPEDELHQQPVDEEAIAPADEEAVEDIKEERTYWGIAWRITLVVLGVFFTVLFIKGFIDADDVEVCQRPSPVEPCISLGSIYL